MLLFNIMIITLWMFVYSLIDTPDYRVHLEARRLAWAIEKYLDDKYNNDKYLCKRTLKNHCKISRNVATQ